VRVIYFRELYRSPLHIHLGWRRECFYIPSEQVVLWVAYSGVFGTIRQFGLSTDEETLRRAKQIARGKIPRIENFTYSDVKEFDYDRHALQSLVHKIREKERLKIEIEPKMEELLKMVGENQNG